MKEWKDQSMKERAAFIRKCVSLGITDNKEIRDFFAEYQQYVEDNPDNGESSQTNGYPVGGRLKNRLRRTIDNAVYDVLDFFQTPKDYSDETAVLRNGKTTTECALWSNDLLRGQGIQIYGDAWTRAGNKGIKKIYSGYNPANRPQLFNESDYNDYVYSAADSIKSVIDPSLLQLNDVVGLYYRRSPNKEKAFLNGANGEVQTHTGHIVIEDGKPYVVHNIHNDITKNRVEDVLGGNKPFGIVSVYRMPLASKKKKSNGGELRTVRVKNILLDN